MDSPRHTCLKLEIDDDDTIFVKGTWFQTHFDISITNGADSWICNASETEVEDRADQWDQPVSEYIETAERYLGFRQPGSTYKFLDAGDGCKRLSWTFEKQGIKLEWRWKCKPSPNNKKTTLSILDFLMDANIRLSDQPYRKKLLEKLNHDKLKVEAEKCLAQSETFSTEKAEFESAIYAKFVGVLNSKKAKLRELRDQLSKQEATGRMPQEYEDSDKTVSYDEKTDDDEIEEVSNQDLGDTSQSVPATRPYSRKRKVGK